MFATAPFKKVSLDFANLRNVSFAFLNAYPGMDNGCFVLRMIPFGILLGYPTAIPVDSAEFLLSQLSFGEQPQRLTLTFILVTLNRELIAEITCPFRGTIQSIFHLLYFSRHISCS